MWMLADPASVRVLAAGLLAMVVVVALGRRTIATLARWRARQAIRADAPQRHQAKAGTPTMGGLLLAPVAGAVSLLLVPTPRVLLAVAVMVAFGAIGLADDILKIRRGRNLGLRARERLAVQAIVALIIALYVLAQGPATGGLRSGGSPSGTGGAGDAVPAIPGSAVSLGSLGTLDLGWLYIPFAVAFMLGFTNAANLADGLDGLAAGITAIVAGAYAVIARAMGFSDVAALAAAVAGAWLGFLRFNRHPARVIMGDVGSNAVGGVLAAIAIVTKTELLLVVVGAVFVMEALSDVLQVAYFKATGGRRIFRMAPIHHHFELVGWSEPAIVRRFWLVSALFALLGLVIAI